VQRITSQLDGRTFSFVEQTMDIEVFLLMV
jgi:hypothetical protein